ncbi:hypothetical protein C0995_011999 [Termitomyces sp. Mi166|nr:hypothetical protein C0995_011999 [Termitomyces sp. Mi166\
MHFSPALFVTIALVLPAFAASDSLINDVESPGEYIVTFKSNNRPSGITHHNPNVIYHYTIINGVAGIFTDDEIQELQASPDVEGVYQDHDGIVVANTYTNNQSPANNTAIQRNATWGLSRMSSYTRLAYTNLTGINFTFYYNPIGGFGVDIYVVDSGVNINHTDFGGCARWGKTAGKYPNKDNDGHGTYCAIYGLDWARQKIWVTGRPSVINLSVGAKDIYKPLDDANIRLIQEKIPVVIAAGNEGRDAWLYSPSGILGAVTVAASNIADEETTWTNYGSAIDIFAGGENIVSAATNSTTGTKIMSGTSMSAAYVTGLVAVFLTTGKHTPAEVLEYLNQTAQHNKLDHLKNFKLTTQQTRLQQMGFFINLI